MDLRIGDVARRTGVTERTLRYYEELGLLEPSRDGSGRRHYDRATLDRLYRIRLLRELGTPVAELDPDAADLAALTRRHLAELDDRIAELARQRERVRAVEDRLLGGQAPGDDALLDLLAGLSDDELTPARRITLLVYEDLAAAHAWLVEIFAFAPGPLTWDDGLAVHGEVRAGDGVIWLHPQAPQHGMLAPSAVGGNVTASLAIEVDDVDVHHDRVAAAGADVVHAPVDQPYGVREYSVCDLEGHLWSFQSPLTDPQEKT